MLSVQITARKKGGGEGTTDLHLLHKACDLFEAKKQTNPTLGSREGASWNEVCLSAERERITHQGAVPSTNSENGINHEQSEY